MKGTPDWDTQLNFNSHINISESRSNAQTVGEFLWQNWIAAGMKQPGMRRKEANHHRVVPSHLPYICSGKGDSRLLTAFFSCLEMCMGCWAQVLAAGSAEQPLWGVAGLLQVRHSPFQMAPMIPPQGMGEPRNQDCDILGRKVSVPRWTILWFYDSNARDQLCNMNAYQSWIIVILDKL